MWLCIVTLVLVAVASVISYNYRSSAANVAAQREAFNRVKAEYDKRIANVAGTASEAPAADTAEYVRLPKTDLICTHPLFCGPQTKFEEFKLAKVMHTPTEAVKRELDQHREQIAAQSAQVEAAGQKLKSLEDIDHTIRTVMAPLVSVTVLLACLYVILSGGYRPDGEKWAFGSIGTIIGFWFKV
jgi:hypothetical protein